jgi:uncharacterized protein
MTILKKLGFGVGLVIITAVGAFSFSAVLTTLPGERTVPAGMKRSSALYVPMSDGVKIAADIWVPENMKSGEKLPVITEMTRYWRAPAMGWAARGLYGLGLAGDDLPLDAKHFNKKRFIYMYIDARGTGASGGNRPSEWSPKEISDYGEIIRWAARQSWSNGRIGANGVSYSGNTAELVASLGEPALKAVAPGYDDFDPLLLNSMPGGAYNTGFTTLWSNAVKALDANDVCAAMEVSGIVCWLTKTMAPGVKLIDSDKSGAIFSEILKTRKSTPPIEVLKGTIYRDEIGGNAQGLRAEDISPYSPARKALLEKYKIPMLIFAGWIDSGSGEGALRRFATFNSPQEVYLGMFAHGGSFDTDPLAPPDGPLGMSEEKQRDILTAFFEKYLRSEPLNPMTEKVLHYFTAGERSWKTTRTWPISGTTSTPFYFDKDQKMSPVQPVSDGSDKYVVNFDAYIGKNTRYHTQNGGIDVLYPDRKIHDRNLLVYDGPALENPITITGTPIVSVNMSSTHSDGLIIAYLEAVSPNGDVKYITEGVLRFVHHKETTEKTPYQEFGVTRSFMKKDGAPLTPGQITNIRIPMYATSIKIPKGYKIRIAIAGAAKDLFNRYPEKENPTWIVSRSKALPSSVTLPIVPAQS